MPFFAYRQNNSGGGFDYDERAGISCFVIVEADSYEEANSIATGIGLYFDGQGDCSCCGDRWSELWSGDGDEIPSIYGEPAGEYLDQEYSHKWMKGYEGFVHYKDGRVEGILK